MTVDLKIVQLHEGRPALNDIPNRLRHLADLIDKGEQRADFALIVIDGDHPMPDMFGYGDAMNTREILGLIELAKAWFVTQVQDDDDATGEDNPA